jgi:deazaflavin-dependent oxidoreductase (nitroreductase family)
MSSPRRLALMRALWRYGNPLVMRLARWTAIWGVVEARGRRSGLPRRVPVAIGRQRSKVWLVAAQGMKAGYVRNIIAQPDVRVRVRGRWYSGRAEVLPRTTSFPSALGWYARSAARLWPEDYRLVRVDLVETNGPHGGSRGEDVGERHPPHSWT